MAASAPRARLLPGRRDWFQLRRRRGGRALARSPSHRSRHPRLRLRGRVLLRRGLLARPATGRDRLRRLATPRSAARRSHPRARGRALHVPHAPRRRGDYARWAQDVGLLALHARDATAGTREVALRSSRPMPSRTARRRPPLHPGARPHAGLGGAALPRHLPGPLWLFNLPGRPRRARSARRARCVGTDWDTADAPWRGSRLTASSGCSPATATLARRGARPRHRRRCTRSRRRSEC